MISGAGCSTASGIGDYRDERGAWKRAQPVQHSDFVSSHEWRQRYWARSVVGYPVFRTAQPNSAHKQLAEWERDGRVVGIITQNVDRLHQQAGSVRVLDLHGRLDEVVCLGCGAISSRDALQRWLETHNPWVQQLDYQAAPDGDADVDLANLPEVEVPTCEACRGVVKPNVVFYGASVPRDVVDQAYALTNTADAVLVVGSSLMVYSSFRFVRAAHDRCIPIAAINLGKTRADEMLTAKLHADCAVALAQLDNSMSNS